MWRDRPACQQRSAIRLSSSAFEEENFALRSLRFLERDLHWELHDLVWAHGRYESTRVRQALSLRKVTSGLSTSIAIWAVVLALLSPDPAAFRFCRPRRANEKLMILWRVRKTAGKVKATRAAAADEGEGSMIGTSERLARSEEGQARGQHQILPIPSSTYHAICP